jgi:hypothetical protein
MKNKTAEQLAEEYTSRQYIDYGDYNYKAEEQVEEAFLEGFSAHKKLTEKILLDLLNKYRSELQDESRIKLGRTPNFEKEVSYRAYIQVLLEIQNKL